MKFLFMLVCLFAFSVYGSGDSSEKAGQAEVKQESTEEAQAPTAEVSQEDAKSEEAKDASAEPKSENAR